MRGTVKALQEVATDSQHRFGCPRCGAGGSDIYITDTRPVDREGISYKRRMRHCKKCKAAWATYELHRGDFERLLRTARALKELREILQEST